MLTATLHIDGDSAQSSDDYTGLTYLGVEEETDEN